MQKLTIGLLVLVMATAVTADPIKQEPRMDIDTFLQMNRLHGPVYDARSFFEGFEGGVIPAGWTQTITNPSRTWGVSSATSTGALEGAYCAFVGYDLYTWQDETISFNHTIDVAGGQYILSFWMAGSRQDSWSNYVSETVEINGVTAFDFDSATQSQFTWEKFFVDLTDYANDQETVTITFRYLGVDGDLHVLDAVMVDDGVGYEVPPPPPPPTNDLCEDAIDLQAQSLTAFQVDLCLASNSYSAGTYPSSCTGYSSNGNDVVYKIYLVAGQVFTISQQGSHDSAIWLVTDCSDPAGTCVIGADATYSGQVETITYTADVSGWYYAIIDGYSGCSLTTVWIDAPVATQDANWSSVKALYR